ncbi:MAG: hypothetical protein C4586_08765 [Anaerolineaceae bacterium]|nr:MAG: hypothetical protein C4586_08765 [Anaerolineaceae bacterium]
MHKDSVLASFHVDASDPEMIKISEDMMGKSITRYLNLREQAVRDALIKAGWTPPGGLPSSFVDIAREALERISGDIYCMGSGCVYCENSTVHPLTWAGTEAQKALDRMKKG